MKRLIERLRQTTPAPLTDAGDPLARDTEPMFIERGEDAPVVAVWSERAQRVSAQPFDHDRGTEVFSRLWSEDRHVAALQPREMKRLCAYFDFVRVPANQEVIGQDEQGDYLLVVLDGTLAVDRVQSWGGRARLAEARAGEMLGEMALLDAGARFSACTTLSPCVLAVINAARLDRMVNEEPRLALTLFAALSRRLSLRLRQVSARLSALLSRS